MDRTFTLDAEFSNGPKGLDAYEYWQPPKRDANVELLYARENSTLEVLEFKVGEVRQVIDGKPKVVRILSYGFIIPKDRSLEGTVVRLERDVNTMALSNKQESVFYGSNRMEIGKITAAVKWGFWKPSKY